MTFGSEQQDIGEIINYIEQEDDCYKVYYLDGSSSEFISGDKDLMDKMEQKMIEQAQEREKSINYNTDFEQTKSSILAILGNLLLFTTIRKEEAIPIILGIIISLICNFNFLDTKRKIRELKKYRILLDNYNDFKNNPQLIKEIGLESIYYDAIDIFSIDKYNLKEVELMYKKLKNQE